MKYCPKCGAKVEKGDRFCFSCGFVLEEALHDTDARMPEEEETSPESEPVFVKTQDLESSGNTSQIPEDPGNP